jgi:predicted heme/steroid binding protein
MNIKKIALFLTACALSLGLFFASSPSVHAQAQKMYTLEELAKFDGKNGARAYFAYDGKIYDVTDSSYWKNGDHFGFEAGKDLSGKMGGAPHGEEVLTRFPVIGTLAAAAATPTPVVKSEPTAVTAQPPITAAPEKKWYEGRIRIANISILGWTGIFLGIFFVLNFATCFALPWSKFPLPWKGNRPGPDPLDAAPTRMHWSQVHKYFAWLTVIFGILHGILGILQLFGVYL